MSVLWTYLGEAPGKNTKTVAVWRTETGERLAWKSTTGTRGAVGFLYRVENFDGDKWPHPEWTGDAADDAAQLILEDRAITSRRRTEQAIAKAKRTLPHQDLLDQVTAFAKGMSWEARQQLADELTRATYRA